MWRLYAGKGWIFRPPGFHFSNRVGKLYRRAFPCCTEPVQNISEIHGTVIAIFILHTGCLKNVLQNHSRNYGLILKNLAFSWSISYYWSTGKKIKSLAYNKSYRQLNICNFMYLGIFCVSNFSKASVM